MTMFGAAYLGYVGGLSEDGFAAGFSGWLWETNEAMLREYPFIAEIDENHIIGRAGHLYCIVPVDGNATVCDQPRPMDRENPVTGTRSLRLSTDRQPASRRRRLQIWHGVAYEADTQVFITDSSGNICAWDPSLDAMSHLAPCTSEAGDYLSFDFTEYAWSTPRPNSPAGFLMAGPA